MINKGLIFDMDGVVVNNDKYHFRAWQVFAEKHGRSVSDAWSYRLCDLQFQGHGPAYSFRDME